MKYVLYISIILLGFSCSTEEAPEQKPDFDWKKEQSSKLNKTIAQKEEVDIRLFLEMRPSWTMSQTGSGLRYWIYESAEEGDSIKSGDIAEIEYSVKLLDGTLCYETEADMYEEVRVDQSDIETGLQEALKLLKVGDKVKLIIPSHLGHGLLGDLDKIPTLRTLVIDLTLLGRG